MFGVIVGDKVSVDTGFGFFVGSCGSFVCVAEIGNGCIVSPQLKSKKQTKKNRQIRMLFFIILSLERS
jgi:hypothetical protein